MATSLGALGETVVVARLDTRQLSRDLTRTRGEVQRQTTRIGRAGSAGLQQLSLGFRSIAASAGFASLGVAALATAFAGLATRAIKTGDEIAKTAKVVGVTAEALQELRFAAERSGVSNRGLDDSLRRLQRRVGEFVNTGAGPAKAALEQLGLATQVASGQIKGTEAVFNAVVEQLRQVASVGERSALAAKLFGDDFGPKLVVLLDEGVEGIARLRGEARSLGLAFSNETAATAEAAADAITNLQTAVGGLVNRLAIELAPALTTAAEAVTDFIASWSEDSIPALEGQLASVTQRIIEMTARLREMRETGVATLGDPERVMGKEILERLLQQRQDIIDEIQLKTSIAGTGTATDGGTGTATGGGAGAKEARGGLSPEELALVEARNRGMGKEEFGPPGPAAPAIPELKPLAIAEQIDEGEQAMARLNSATEAWSGSMAGALAGLAVGDQSFEGFAKSVIKNMIAMALQAALTAAVGAAMSAAFGNPAAGAAAASTATTVLGTLTALLSGGVATRGSGGPVYQGQPYIVGERGPELFVPRETGDIVPNGAPFIQGVSIDARGSPAGVGAEIDRALTRFEQRLGPMMAERKRRGI